MGEEWLECVGGADKEKIADLVLGSRLKGKMEDGSISRFNMIGNHILSFTASFLHMGVSDVCTGCGEPIIL